MMQARPRAKLTVPKSMLQAGHCERKTILAGKAERRRQAHEPFKLTVSKSTAMQAYAAVKVGRATQTLAAAQELE